jgi:hypothetical protein
MGTKGTGQAGEHSEIEAGRMKPRRPTLAWLFECDSTMYT